MTPGAVELATAAEALKVASEALTRALRPVEALEVMDAASQAMEAAALAASGRKRKRGFVKGALLGALEVVGRIGSREAVESAAALVEAAKALRAASEALQAAGHGKAAHEAIDAALVALNVGADIRDGAYGRTA